MPPPPAPQKLRLDKLDMKAGRLESGAAYKARMGMVQKDLVRIQQTYQREGRRALIVFEGWDAAGKGGCIRRLTEPLDARRFHVWPIGAPKPEEQGRHYLYRFWMRLPVPGAIAVFDRSWYGRVLVERVEGFADAAAWKRAYNEINEFERTLIDDGVRIVKLFLHITPEEQLSRFRDRLTDPSKQWKINEEDLRNRQRWDDYVVAVEDMFDRTSTRLAPWHLIPANCKETARVIALETIAGTLRAGITVTPPPIDPKVRELAGEVLGIHFAPTGKEPG